MQYKRISADCHLDMPWLPAELFVSEAKRELKERMPYVVDGADGPHWTTKAGVNMGLCGGVGSVGGEPAVNDTIAQCKSGGHKPVSIGCGGSRLADPQGQFCQNRRGEFAYLLFARRGIGNDRQQPSRGATRLAHIRGH